MKEQEREGRSEQEFNTDSFKLCSGKTCEAIANSPFKYFSAFWMMILATRDQIQNSSWAQNKAAMGVLCGPFLYTPWALIYTQDTDIEQMMHFYQFFIWPVPGKIKIIFKTNKQKNHDSWYTPFCWEQLCCISNGQQSDFKAERKIFVAVLFFSMLFLMWFGIFFSVKTSLWRVFLCGNV